MDSFTLMDSDISTDSENSDTDEIFNMPYMSDMNKLINRTTKRFFFNKVIFNDIHLSKDISFIINDSRLYDSTILYK